MKAVHIKPSEEQSILQRIIQKSNWIVRIDLMDEPTLTSLMLVAWNPAMGLIRGPLPEYAWKNENDDPYLASRILLDGVCFFVFQTELEALRFFCAAQEISNENPSTYRPIVHYPYPHIQTGSRKSFLETSEEKIRVYWSPECSIECDLVGAFFVDVVNDEYVLFTEVV